MVDDECDYVMSNKGKPQIKTYRNLEGKIINQGDTGAEENMWDAQILGVACAMMPESPTRNIWINQLIKLTLNAMARPSDLINNQIYNGKPLKNWLVGSNINEDGTVINHNIIHPDYMTSLFELNSAKFFYLAGLPIPKALVLNADVVFYALADLRFKVGDTILGRKIETPGGTIFIKNSGDIYYPIGTDWGKSRRMNFVMANSSAAMLTSKYSIKRRAEKWVILQGYTALAMQNRFSDGHSYLNKSEDSYPSCEEWVADQASTAYTIEMLKTISKPKLDNKSYLSKNIVGQK